MKLHQFIIIAIVIGFSTFLLGYSLPPFLEVGFGGGDTAIINGDGGTVNQADLKKQFEELYKQVEE